MSADVIIEFGVIATYSAKIYFLGTDSPVVEMVVKEVEGEKKPVATELERYPLFGWEENTLFSSY